MLSVIAVNVTVQSSDELRLLMYGWSPGHNTP